MSPGGSMPSCRRSSPDEPPSSAMVTTALVSKPRSSRQRSTAGRPVPPPMATAGGRLPRSPALPVAPDVAMADGDAVAASRAGSVAVVSARATLRCMPPVQPSAMARWCLPSMT